MKPNFALTLSFEGIGLLHRAFPGWHTVGEVGLDAPDLAAALAALHDQAMALDPSGVRSKLVIPNDQIRYLQFDALGLDADEIGDAARRALDGSTPYNVDDLVFDWSISAGQVHVAAVARETLAEAEAFATEHRFNPLCFVAVPEAREFVGEPWFGQTKAAATLLPEGGHVERDTAAIRIIGAAPPPVAPEPETPPPAADADSSATPQSAEILEERPTASAEAEPIDLELPEPGSSEPALGSVLSQEVPPLEEEITAPNEALPSEALSSAGLPSDTTVEPPESLDTDAEDASTAETGFSDAPAPQPAVAEPPKTDPQPVAFSSIRARRDDLPGGTPRLEGATRTPPKPTEDPPAEPAASGRREPPLTTSAPAPDPDIAAQTSTHESALSNEAAARIGASLRPVEVEDLGPETDLPQPVETATDPTFTDPERSPDPRLNFEDTFVEAQTPAAEPVEVSAPAQPTEPVSQRAPGAFRAPSFFTRRQASLKRERPKDRVNADPSASREQERQRMTVFGAREPVRVGGKPRFLGVILTAVLLIFLVGVAAWASIFLDDGLASVLRDKDDEVAEITATPDADIDLADNEPDTAPQDETVLAALPGVTTDVEETPRTALPAPDPAELTAEEARARYAVTGIWLRAPDAPRSPEILSLDDFYLTSIDPKVLEQDAVALPDVSALLNDTRPITPSDPPAASTTYDLDERGLVRATPQGALTPDGVEVFAGQPRLAPPERPEAPQIAAPESEEAIDDPALARLAAFRPKARPEDLSEQNERSNLGGRTLSELANLRPKLRPQSAQELAQQAAAASTAGLVQTDPDAVENAIAAAVQTPDPFAGATAQAVASSIKPKNRPRNFERIVRRTQQRQQEPVQTAAAVPRAQRVSPSAPTATTVARAATEKNALRLRRVNLIGVYGSPSDRRALVRLANGRYKKVKIGDRLDGGRVAAIGDSELRYVKSGRSVTLTMPRG